MDKGYQVKLVVNEFREVIYIQLRKYFLSYEGDWVPSREGISIPASIQNIQAMLDGLFDICANNEAEEVVTRYIDYIAKK